MKKLLLILLLLFPVHGAWAENLEFFGIKLGDKVSNYIDIFTNSSERDMAYNDINLLVKIFEEDSDSPRINTSIVVDPIPQKRNKYFYFYTIRFTPENKLIHSINASGYIMPRNIRQDKFCKEQLDSIKDIIEKKYAFSFGLPNENVDIHSKQMKKLVPIYTFKSRKVYSYQASKNGIIIHMVCKTDIGNFKYIRFYVEDLNLKGKIKFQKNKIIKKLRDKIDKTGFE